MKTDIEISQQATLWPITKIIEQLHIDESMIDCYGRYKAKVRPELWRHLPEKQGKLILVTAINPTPFGEGKSTISIGLADAMNACGYQTALALREPSLGPVMGLKGGATGGGYSQVVPMEDINLHFTGDIHAITAANNALSALIDNHLERGNHLNIDPRQILWKRVVDMNDRALRHIVIGLGGVMQGVPREDGFDITVASEIMAVLCLATSYKDLKERLGNILIAYTYDQQPVYVKDLQVEGALALLLKDAFQPNIVQTLEHTPTFIHGGPFANIAHGCNSIQATRASLALADYTITEAGFGADLGGEKFLDLVVPKLGKAPDAVVIVATCRSLKYNGGVALEQVNEENVEAVKQGAKNLQKHIATMQQCGRQVVVAINRFVTDSQEEIQAIQTICKEQGVQAVSTTVWENGSQGGKELASEVARLAEQQAPFSPIYQATDSLEEKAHKIVQKVYGGSEVVFEGEAIKDLKQLKALKLDHLPLCMAKTQYSLSDNPTKLGRPEGFTIHIRKLIPKTGAGFIVALTGDVMTMPGLPEHPAALNMDIDDDGKASGLF